jgi:hypothetical protein
MSIKTRVEALERSAGLGWKPPGTLADLVLCHAGRDDYQKFDFSRLAPFSEAAERNAAAREAVDGDL